MKEKIYRIMIELTNGKITSNLIRYFASSKLSKIVIASFAKFYKINLDEMKKPINEYESLSAFFIRELKEGVHVIEAGENIVISPVDAVIEDMGTINEDCPITVKNRQYSITEMVGSEEIAHRYLGGTYIVFYLSPQDYHRIHAPIDGVVTHTNVLGNKSYPVNKLGMKYGKDPLSKNYRQLIELKNHDSYLMMVNVGAQFVNSIVQTNNESYFIKGDEAAYFSFGSTVVLLFEKDKFLIDKSICVPHKIRMGQQVATLR